MRRFLAIAWKELVQLRRDRATLGMMVGLPVMQLLLFGYAINTDVRHIPTVVVDDDRSAASRDFARSLEATGFYDVRGYVRGIRDVERALRSGEARVALIMPRGLGASLTAGHGATVQLVVAPIRRRWRAPPRRPRGSPPRAR